MFWVKYKNCETNLTIVVQTMHRVIYFGNKQNQPLENDTNRFTIVYF